MIFARELRTIRNSEGLREKIVEMATEFCLEASVLIVVLGILDSAISAHGWPGKEVFVLSVLVGAAFFAMACIIQVYKAANDDEPAPGEEETNASGNS